MFRQHTVDVLSEHFYEIDEDIPASNLAQENAFGGIVEEAWIVVRHDQPYSRSLSALVTIAGPRCRRQAGTLEKAV